MAGNDDVPARQEHASLVVDAVVYQDPGRGSYSYRLLDVAETDAPPEVGKALQLAVGERAVVRHRLMLYDTDPVELSWSYYPMSIAAGTELTQRQRIVGGAPRVLADTGLAMTEFSDRVSARMPTTEEVELLELPPNVPVIRQFRVVSCRDDRPVEVSILVKGAHLRELRYHQAIGAEDAVECS